VWEFRTKYQNLQYRLLAFWDKTQEQETLVFATHGVIKKQTKCLLKKLKRQRKLENNILNN
jgi:hypothetical protein